MTAFSSLGNSYIENDKTLIKSFKNKYEGKIKNYEKLNGII